MIRIVLSITIILFLSGCTRFIFYPEKRHYFSPEVFKVKHEEVFFKSRDGLRLHGWWLLSEQPKKATIVFMHGNAQNISTHIAGVYWLPKYGYDVFIFDYRGYGYSQGITEIDGVIRDTEDAISYSQTRTQQENLPLIVMGQSLGASLAIFAVANHPAKENLDALISISAFSDYQKVTQEALSSWWLTWLFQWPLSKTINNDYAPGKYIADISPVPLLVLHSEQDEIIAYHHGADLYQAAAEPKYFQQTTGLHNNVFKIESNRELILGFLEQVIGSSVQ